MDHTCRDQCGCCEPPVPAAPVPIGNPSGLSAVRYRIGTFATFRAAMLDRLHDEPSLAGLTTRASDDYGITVLELWAAVADVLTFYQERIANETFLRTAVHRDSVLRLARLLNYQLRPGLAAEARLSFTIDPNQLPGKRPTARIPAGVKVMSVPGQGEQPQFFETVEDIIGDARLNALWALPVPTWINPLREGATGAPVLLRPASLAPGDRLLVCNAVALEEKSVTRLDVVETPLGVHLHWDPPIQGHAFIAEAAHVARIARTFRFFSAGGADTFQYYDAGTLAGDAWTSAPRWRSQSVEYAFAAGEIRYPLDARYEDLKPGMPLLINTAASPDPMRLAAIVDVGQDRAALHPQHPQQDTVTVVTLTRVIRDAPVVLSREPGRLDVFARSGTDSALHLEWTGSTWQGWEALGGLVTSALAAASSGPDRLDVFTRGLDGALYHRRRVGTAGGAWQPGAHAWERIGGVLTSAPVVVARGANRLDVFARGLDAALWHLEGHDTGWSGVASLGGAMTSAPVATATGPDRVDVFARGRDNALWQIWGSGADWSGWRSLGGSVSEDFCVVSRAPQRLDVFARALDGALQTISWNGAQWSAWATLTTGIVGTPTAVSWGSHRLDVFARKADGALTHLAWNGTAWSAPTVLPGAVTSDPVAVSWGANRLDVFARGLDGGLRHRSWSGSSWSGWSSIGHGLGHIPDRRRTLLYRLDPQEIVLRQYDYPDAITGSRITVPLGLLDTVDKKRTILLHAPPLAPHLATVTGSRRIAAIPGSPPDHLAIDFTPALPAAVPSGATRLLGNVARATHGQTTASDEILGDGNAAAPFQRFVLRQAPLTYVASSTRVQGESTLDIVVNGERWSEVSTLYGQPPTSRVYVLRQDDDGRTTVHFGDGVTGARLPSGRGNVIAHYRYGLGLAGRVVERQLSIALTRPLGVKDVSNPAAAEGGADPESRDAARIAAPTTVRTFGRAVSMTDFESLATASGEAARASATWVWHALEKAVHLTVAAQGGASLSAEALDRLRQALDRARDPNHALLLGNVCRVPVTVAATLMVEETYARADVLAAARQALVDFFSFENLALGRSIHRSDIYAVLQGVAGVRALDLDAFHVKGYAAWSAQELAMRGATSHPLQLHVRIFRARACSAAILAYDRVWQMWLAGADVPAVLSAELAWLEDPWADVALTATGGIG